MRNRDELLRQIAAYNLDDKLKALADRLTAARAEKIDNLDVAVSTRAPANTAVSNAVLTDARIGNLDNLAWAPLRIKRIVSGSIEIPVSSLEIATTEAPYRATSGRTRSSTSSSSATAASRSATGR